MDELVERLAKGEHPLIARRYDSAEELKEAIDRGYVLLTFTDTRGGTELGVRLEEDACDLSKADFDGGTGTVHLEGGLILNYVRVRHISDLDVASREGEGHLVIVEEVQPGQV